ncbi:MAG: hypothetical protein ABTQ26_02615 [Azonexus sp.]
MKTTKIFSLAIGSAFAAATLTPVAHAANDNPFGATKLAAGYQLAQADTKKMDGKCGEAKCGAEKKAAEKKKDGKCGEAKCGADKKAAEAKCGADKKGEAKCGADKK